VFQNSIGYFRKQVKSFQQQFAPSIFFFFFGFLLGNLFGTLLPAIRTHLWWDGWLLILLLFVIELISYKRYHRVGRPFLAIYSNKQSQGYPASKNKTSEYMNVLKIGVLIGFFIDAFKVGS
jgi:hypothetical protein